MEVRVSKGRKDHDQSCKSCYPVLREPIPRDPFVLPS